MSLLDRLIGCRDDFMWKSGPVLSDIADAIERSASQEQPTMTEHEMERRERCVDLAVKYAAYRDGADLTDIARAIHDFITGVDRAALADEAKAAVDRLAR